MELLGSIQAKQWWGNFTHMPDPTPGDLHKSTESLGRTLCGILERLDDEAAKLLNKDIEPDLLAACAVGHLGGYGPDYIRIHMNERPLDVLISGIVVVKRINDRFSSVQEFFNSLRRGTGAKTDLEASAYTKMVTAATALFPSLPPDVTLDTIVRDPKDFDDLLRAMRSFSPAEAHEELERSDLREFRLSHAQLKLLGDSS